MRSVYNKSIHIVLLLLAIGTGVCNEAPKRIVGCGEQCVRILCSFYRIPCAENEVLARLKPNERGEASFADLQRCLNAYDLNCFAFRGTVQDIETINYPIIVHLKLDELQHYVVVMKSPSTCQFMGYDPIVGPEPRQIDLEKFSRVWTGAGLIVFPKDKKVKRSSFVCLSILVFMATGYGLGKAIFSRRHPAIG